MLTSIDALTGSSAYQASKTNAPGDVPDTQFDDVLAQLTSAADALTAKVQAAEDDLSGKLDQLYAKGQTALHDPRAIQWTDAQSAEAAAQTTAGVTQDPATEAPATQDNVASLSSTDGFGSDAQAALLQALRLYSKTDAGFLTKGLP